MTTRTDALVPAVPSTMRHALLDLDHVTKRYGATTALDDVSLTVSRGEMLAVVGPSGCGKSTLLRTVAGLVGVDGGRVRLAGREVAGPGVFVPPEKRGVAVVFQDLALFPHLSVAGNVAFGLGRVARRGAGERDERVAEVLDLVGLSHLSGRFPHELSGGEQQRVALARALAPRPSVVLLDEPFSHLDRGLAAHVRVEAVAVLRAADATVVLVTHDQDEALAVGDRVAVLRSGRIEQVGTPSQVFHSPASRFVATFLGEADFVPGQWDGASARTALGALPVVGNGTGPVDVMTRPHDLTVLAEGSDLAADAAAAGGAVGTVVRTEFRGGSVLHHVRLADGSLLRALAPHTLAVPSGGRVVVPAPTDHALATFDPA